MNFHGYLILRAIDSGERRCSHRMARRALRSVGRAAVDTLRGDIRPRRRRRRDAAHTARTRRSRTRQGDAMAPGPARRAAVRRRTAARTDLAGNDHRLLRGDVRAGGRNLHLAVAMDRRDRGHHRGRLHACCGRGDSTVPATARRRVGSRRPATTRSAVTSSTCSSTGRTRCCRGSRSSARGSCWAGSCRCGGGGGRPSASGSHPCRARGSCRRSSLPAQATSTASQGSIFSTDPLDRSIVYVASALGTALLAYAAIDWLAERFPGRPTRCAAPDS